METSLDDVVLLAAMWLGVAGMVRRMESETQNLGINISTCNSDIIIIIRNEGVVVITRNEKDVHPEDIVARGEVKKEFSIFVGCGYMTWEKE